MQLVDHNPTRSPRRMPSDQSPRATRSASSLSSAQVRRFCWWQEATARRPGKRLAVRSSRPPMVSSSRGRFGPCDWLKTLRFSSMGMALVLQTEKAVYTRTPG